MNDAVCQVRANSVSVDQYTVPSEVDCTGIRSGRLINKLKKPFDILSKGPSFILAGMAGFKPENAGSKGRHLTTCPPLSGGRLPHSGFSGLKGATSAARLSTLSQLSISTMLSGVN